MIIRWEFCNFKIGKVGESVGVIDLIFVFSVLVSF